MRPYLSWVSNNRAWAATSKAVAAGRWLRRASFISSRARRLAGDLPGQLGRGLVVLVLRNAQALALEELSRDLPERARLARDGKLAPSDMAGGTFTVNNYGVFGVDGSAGIINHPEAAEAAEKCHQGVGSRATRAAGLAV